MHWKSMEIDISVRFSALWNYWKQPSYESQLLARGDVLYFLHVSSCLSPSIIEASDISIESITLNAIGHLWATAAWSYWLLVQ